MDSITGKMTRIVWRSPKDGFKIAKFRQTGTDSDFSIKGELAESNLDIETEIRGSWVENGSYGREFHVNNMIRNVPKKPQDVAEWIVKRKLGIGPTTVAKMLATFGDKFGYVIEFEHEKLTEFRGVNKEKAQKASTTWIEEKDERELLILLGNEISDKIAKKVIKRYPINTIQIIEDNPYKLTEVSGIGFKTADRIAMGFGWSVQRPERIDYALTFILNEAVSNGHSFLHKAELVEKVCRLAEIEVDGKASLLAESEALAAIERTVVRGQIKSETVKTNSVAHQLYYLPYYYELEVEAASLIADLALTPHVPLKNIASVLTKVEAELSLTLSEQQKEGVISGLGRNCSIITGLPGTGKTSTVKALVATARNLGLAVQLAAPTGRAAKRLSEVTGVQALTIHRLLGYQEGGFTFDQKNKLYCNLLILDEASMIDLELMVSVLRAVPDDCSVIWIGDINQLPSVGAGTILRDLINSKRIHTTVLDKIFRQAEGSMIIQNAHRIHRGEMPVFPGKGENGDSYWIKVPRAKNEATGQTTDDLEFVRTKLPEIYERLEEKYGIDPVKDIQVLTPMRIGPAGYTVFNEIIQKTVNPFGERIQIGNQGFRIGDRVMQTKNDYKLEVYNGDVGFIREVMMEEKGLLIEFSDRELVYPFDSTDNLALSYAVSTHKAQGSEFKIVIILLLNHHYVMLDRNLIYTANTRAREMCIYLASHGAIETAVRTQNVQKRNSLLAQRIRTAADIDNHRMAA